LIVTKVNKHLDRSVRTLVVAVSLAAVGAGMAAPAQADPIDDSFLAALTDAGVAFDNPVDTVALGKAVCPMLIEPGKNFAKVYSRVADNGIPPDVAAFFMGIAISMYCPQMMASVGNGTVLDWLPAARAIPGF
jgi:sugar/nucleoside kinase (ribokinase family)